MVYIETLHHTTSKTTTKVSHNIMETTTLHLMERAGDSERKEEEIGKWKE